MDTTDRRELELSAELAQRLIERDWKCATAESCTGGLMSSWITSLGGASDYFPGGIVAYSNQAKTQLLAVSQETLEQFGAVSDQCAFEMAQGAQQVFLSEVGISTTGIAGPGGATEGKPVGLVYVAASTPNVCDVRELRLDGDRLQNIRDSAIAALEFAIWLIDHEEELIAEQEEV